MTRRLFLISLALFLVFFCSESPETLIKKFEQGSKKIAAQTIPDKTLDVYEFQLSKDPGWILKGETTLPEAADRVRRLADSLLGGSAYQDETRLLPDAALGDSIFAVVIVSVTPLRREARHASEMLDQVIMGNSLQLLEKKGGWYRAQNHYGYIGWVNKTAIQRMDKSGLENWINSNRLQVTTLSSFVYQKPDFKALHLADLVLNATLKKSGRKGKWIKVELADGEKGFVPAADLGPLVEKKDPGKVPAAAIIRSAKRMLGIPYLWGGKSSKANDCSGFTQTVFRANGIQLPRDARQQALLGKTIVPNEDFSNVQPGDLLFFGVGKRITHVGISLGGYKFIHQDSDVHINSFDERAENFNAFRKKSLKLIKRILK